MFGLKKSPLKVGNTKVDPGYPHPPTANPFDSDDESDKKQTLKPSRKTPPESSRKPSRKPSSEHNLTVPNNFGANPFDDDGETQTSSSSSSSYSLYSSARNKYKNDFRDTGGVESQSVQELEGYAVYKAEETTKAVHGCLKIAEEIREDATKTLVTLHQQGEQITRNHNVTVEIDQDLSRGEKLLGSLGGIFSKTWKPKKGHSIRGPVITRDSSPQRRGNHLEQREKLGLNPAPKGISNTRTPPPESADAFQKVEFEKGKQDDALSDLSNLLGELKGMAVDMGTEIDRHTKALDHFQDDVDELNVRVKGANVRGRRLLGK
ncbi:soluble N-ethylmaleimide-sensitive factor adaptor protein 33 [Euphorbia peplus]|nr:soluble N-ethylmaleimide-sensitive factor adaptor protein 33 [Euphorbia peplus]